MKLIFARLAVDPFFGLSHQSKKLSDKEKNGLDKAKDGLKLDTGEFLTNFELVYQKLV